MADPVQIFDPERWVHRWTTFGGTAGWEGIRWPWTIWLPAGQQSFAERQLYLMLIRTGPRHIDQVQHWARNNHWRLGRRRCA